MAIAIPLPSSVGSLVQEGLIQRAFHDGLFPALMYRAEALYEEWPEHSGEELVMTRPGLLAPVTEPIAPGVDPVPTTAIYEQWIARLLPFANTQDVNIPTSTVAAQNLFLRTIHQMGLNAGQSINSVARNNLFKAYLSGHTVTTAAAIAGATTITVAALNGFVDVLNLAVAARPQNVSPATPLNVTVNGVANTVVGAFPADPTDPYGPGVLQLGTALAAPVAARSPVLSEDRPAIVRAGGGASVDAIGAGDILTLQNIIEAVNILRTSNVQPHEDGYYHAHLLPLGNSQLFADPAVQRLNTALPEHAIYKEAFIGTLAGAMAMLNNENPYRGNAGRLTATGANAQYARGIGGEVVNDSGIQIGRVMITGRGCLYEKHLPSTSFVTEAGLTGKMGEFDIVNGGIRVETEHIDLIIRAPVDRLQQTLAVSWRINTSFTAPTDRSAPGSDARYRRAIVIEHAL